VPLKHDKQDKIGRACDMQGGEEKYLQGFGGET
jgi:hypothetical protein